MLLETPRPDSPLGKKLLDFQRLACRFSIATPYVRVPFVELLGKKTRSKEEVADYWRKFLETAQDPFLSLYVHIPFCKGSVCNYCMYGTKIPESPGELDEYLEFLAEEARFFAPIFSKNKLSTLYFGGGTPSILGERQLEFLLGMIFENFEFKDDAGTKCIEFSPTTLTSAKVGACIRAGIDRISLGVQSTDPQVLAAANRESVSLEELEEMVGRLNKLGLNDLNLDLMAGLPGDTPDKFLKSVEDVLSLEPPSMTICRYRHNRFEHGHCASGMCAEYLPPYDIEKTIALMSPLLSKYGYRRMQENLMLENQQFLKNGHFPKITNPTQPEWRLQNSTLGIGPKSNSFIKHGLEYALVAENAKCFGDCRFSVKKYSKEEQMRDFASNGVYREKKIQPSEFKRRFGRDFFGEFKSEAKQLVALGKAGIGADSFEVAAGNAQELAALFMFFYDPRQIREMEKLARSLEPAALTAKSEKVGGSSARPVYALAISNSGNSPANGLEMEVGLYSAKGQLLETRNARIASIPPKRQKTIKLAFSKDACSGGYLKVIGFRYA